MFNIAPPLTAVKVIVLALVFCCQPSLADDSKKPDARPTFRAVRINFVDATVRDYLEFINASLPADHRVISTKAAEAVTLPRIDLTCRADLAVRLLEPLTANAAIPLKVTILSSKDGMPQVLVVDVTSSDTRPVAAAVNVRAALDTLAARSATGGQKDKQAALATAQAQLVAAIKAGIEANFSNGGTPLAIKYHEASGLMFLKGTRAQTEFAREVIAELAK